MARAAKSLGKRLLVTSGVMMVLAGFLALLLLVSLEYQLSGPFGDSLRVAYMTSRTFLRDALTPRPPSIAEYVNEGPNVVVIVIDCYRADYLDGAAPRLEAFSQTAWRFDLHQSSANWTKPSTGSLFTGLWPRKHGVLRGGTQKLPQQANTLAELMRKRGYATAGFIQGVHIRTVHAFDQGFQFYSDHTWRGSKSLLGQFFSWILKIRPPRFFAYVHFLGTHDPYYYDNDLKGLLSAPPYSSNITFTNDDYIMEVNNGQHLLAADEVAHLTHIARAKAKRVDRQAIGHFLDAFLASPLHENTMVIITSDHGDSFFEHGFVSHGRTVHWPETHIPLVISLPESFTRRLGVPKSGVHDCPTSTVDLFATVLDFAGVSIPGGIDGVSLIPEMGRGGDCERPVISEATADNQVSLAALISGQLKLIVNYRDGVRKLYDLSTDPLWHPELSRHLPERSVGRPR